MRQHLICRLAAELDLSPSQRFPPFDIPFPIMVNPVDLSQQANLPIHLAGGGGWQGRLRLLGEDPSRSGLHPVQVLSDIAQRSLVTIDQPLLVCNLDLSADQNEVDVLLAVNVRNCNVDFPFGCFRYLKQRIIRGAACHLV